MFNDILGNDKKAKESAKKIMKKIKNGSKYYTLYGKNYDHRIEEYEKILRNVLQYHYEDYDFENQDLSDAVIDILKKAKEK